MPPNAEDVRKKFILATVENFFGLGSSWTRAVGSLTGAQEMDNFLDDVSEFVLSVNKSGAELQVSNKARPLQLYFTQPASYHA